MGRTPALWLRWSWRDLRRRWALVAAIALVIATGTGIFAGLGGTSEWRVRSNDASYAALAMHDLEVELPAGSSVTEGELLGRALAVPGAGAITAAAERLVVPTQVDASSAGDVVLVPGRIVGMPADGPRVDALHVERGRGLRAGAGDAVLELKFARHFDLPPEGTVRLSGGREVRYGGLGYSPEYFLITGDQATLLAEANFGVVFMPLDAAQQVTGRPGAVNNLALRLGPDADRAALRATLAAAMRPVGGTVNVREDDDGHRLLYEDAANDQQVWDLFAVLVLLGAGFAAFNLVSRIVEAERREIGVGMALGVRPRVLALRHVLVGAQVALIGVVAGTGVGLLFAAAMRSLFEQVLPLPEWRTPLLVGRYLQAAALGLLLPLVATALPVWRAVRVEPVEAMRTGAHAGRAPRSGLVRLLRRVPLPGRTFRQMPFRNILRAPRRTVLTALGIGAAITTMVVVLGAVDSFVATVDRSEAEATRSAPDRLLVHLDGFRATNGDVVRAVREAPATGAVEANVELAATAAGPGGTVELRPRLIDFDGGMWTPTGSGAGDADGIVLSEKAAADLGVGPGDAVVLRHPRKEGASFRVVESTLPVAGLHPDPLRFAAYLDLGSAGRFGLEGVTNLLQVRPAEGEDAAAVQRALFTMTGVASAQPVGELSRLVRERMEETLGILRVLQAAVLGLALLIAFNSASITVDERAREQATMFAFGLRLRTVLGIITVESVLVGVLGTLVGIAGGVAVLRWMVEVLLPRTLPELAVTAVLSWPAVLTTMALGVGVVGLAPLAMARRLRRMDVPSTLRIVE